jgi:VanZ family protein
VLNVWLALERSATRLRFRFRVAFLLFVPVLFTATHWPKLEIPGEGRPDLVIHIVAFGTWATLLIGCGFFGKALSWRNIGAVLLVAAAYAAFDEATQAIPWVRRHAALDDYLANLLGIVLACGGAVLLMKVRGVLRSRQQRQPNTAAKLAAPR